MSAKQIDLAMRYSAAWARHDPDAIVAMHTEDIVFHMHGMAEPAIGAAATRTARAQAAQSSQFRRTGSKSTMLQGRGTQSSRR